MESRSTCPRQYFRYLGCYYNFFNPGGTTGCTNGCDKIRNGVLYVQFIPLVHGCVYGTPKLKILLKFCKIWIKIYVQICIACRSFWFALAVQIWTDLHEGLWSYGSFKNLMGKLLVRPHNVHVCRLAATLAGTDHQQQGQTVL